MSDPRNIDAKLLHPPLFPSDLNELKVCRDGYILYNKHDQYVGKSFEYYGEFSQKETELFTQIIRPGMIVLDIGANIGAHTIFFARATTNQGFVFAFEPQRIVFQTLCANMALNNITNVQCLQQAVGSESGSIIVPHLDYHQSFNYGGLALGEYQQGEKVPVVTLEQLELPQCHFIKIDVEGMEKQVLLGSINVIRKFWPIMYIENDRVEKSADLIALLLDIDYKLYWHTPPLYSPSNYFNNAENIFSNTVSVNMLCIPKQHQVTVNGLREIKTPQDSWQKV